MFEGVKRKRSFEREVVGIGRIILRSETDRANYVQHCYQTSTVSMISRANMDIVHDVEIDTTVLSNIQFPESEEYLGSTVVWVNIPYYNTPVIVAILNNKNEMTQVEEGSFSFLKSSGDGTVSVQGLTKGCQINLSAMSSSGKGGIIRVNVGNVNNTGLLNIVVSGDLKVEAMSSTQNYNLAHEVVIYDGKDDSLKTNHKMSNEEIESRIMEGTSGHKYNEDSYEIGDASSTAVMAEAMEEFMHSVLDELGKATTTTSLGTQPLLNSANIIALKSKTSDFFSKYLKIQ